MGRMQKTELSYIQQFAREKGYNQTQFFAFLHHANRQRIEKSKILPREE